MENEIQIINQFGLTKGIVLSEEEWLSLKELQKNVLVKLEWVESDELSLALLFTPFYRLEWVR